MSVHRSQSSLLPASSSSQNKMQPSRVSSLSVKDVRFPTSLEGDGSDAINDPDYSCAYVILKTDTGQEGYGLTFTIGRGNEIVCLAVQSYTPLIVGRKLEDIFNDFSGFWNELVQEPQMRWLGPEKGVVHLAIAAIMNALWDLWARMEGKPLWKLLADMEPEKLASCMVFNYMTDAITKDEVIEMLKRGKKGREEREERLMQTGYPAYTTSAGWLGYSDSKIKRLCKEALDQGFTRFKVKVGLNQEDDIRRVGLVRHEIGPDKMLMTDANQRWDVQTAIDWMQPLAKYNVTWIEEPTSPDDVLGHAKIRQALQPLGIGVATGEACQNRIMFKQFLQGKALDYCQIDAARQGGLNEILPVVMLAAKLGVPVCPHAGGVGLCELVQHISMFDYLCVSCSMENRVIEFVDHLHEHFVSPVVMTGGCYQVPKDPGYSVEMKPGSLSAYEYPNGPEWQKLFAGGLFKAPSDT